MDDSTPIIDVTPHPAGYVPSDDFWAFLRRRKGIIGFFWLIGLGIGLWWLLSSAPVYEAQSRVMIVRTGSGGPVSEAELASEIELVRDPTHLDKVAAKQLTNPSDAQIHQLQSKIDSELTVEPAGKSNLVAIRYRDTDPAVAARIVNQIVDFYLADRRFIFQPGTRAGPDPPSSADADLLSAFDVLHHGAELRPELERRVQQRIELENRIAELKGQISDHQEVAASLHKRLTGLPDRIHSRTLTRSGSTRSAQQVEETEITNPLKEQVESDLVKAETAAAGLRARLDHAFTALREAGVIENRISALSSERNKLERRVLDARSSADSSGRDAGDRPNLKATLISRANPPSGPAPQRDWIWFAAAFWTALAVALLLAWIIDQFDKPIYTSDDFERASGAPPVDHFSQGAGA